MVDRHALSTRLDALASYLAELKSFRRLSREEFVSEPAAHHLAERYLHLACECILDIAHHVVSDQGYRQPGSYDVFDVKWKGCALLRKENRRSPERMSPSDLVEHVRIVGSDFSDNDSGPLPGSESSVDSNSMSTAG